MCNEKYRKVNEDKYLEINFKVIFGSNLSLANLAAIFDTVVLSEKMK